MSAFIASPELQLSVEQFYYREARLLDGRQYRSWLQLMDEKLRYIVPSRVNVQVPNREQGKEEMIGVARELEGVDSDGCPIREENYLYMTVRVERAYKKNSWSENPPARTRRMVGNVEILSHDGGKLEVQSNFHMFYARPASENFLYSGQRKDLLIEAGESYRLLDREVILDYANIDYPTLGLFF